MTFQQILWIRRLKEMHMHTGLFPVQLWQTYVQILLSCDAFA